MPTKYVLGSWDLHTRIWLAPMPVGSDDLTPHVVPETNLVLVSVKGETSKSWVCFRSLPVKTTIGLRVTRGAPFCITQTTHIPSPASDHAVGEQTSELEDSWRVKRGKNSGKQTRACLCRARDWTNSKSTSQGDTFSVSIFVLISLLREQL